MGFVLVDFKWFGSIVWCSPADPVCYILQVYPKSGGGGGGEAAAETTRGSTLRDLMITQTITSLSLFHLCFNFLGPISKKSIMREKKKEKKMKGKKR